MLQPRNLSTKSCTTRFSVTRTASLWTARRTSISGKRFPTTSRRCVVRPPLSSFELTEAGLAQNLLAIIAKDRERLAALEAARIVFPEEREKIVQSEAPAKRRKSTNGARREFLDCLNSLRLLIPFGTCSCRWSRREAGSGGLRGGQGEYRPTSGGQSFSPFFTVFVVPISTARRTSHSSVRRRRAPRRSRSTLRT